MGYLVSLVWWTCGILLAILSVTSADTVTWVERPQSVSAREGQSVTFKCRLSTNANVNWAANNKDGVGQDLFINGDKWTNDPRYSLVDGNNLLIQNITKADNRVYACKTKDAGIQTATLTVLLFPGPPVVTPDTTGQVYTEGQQVRFTCSSTGGNPSPRIVWMKNGNISNAPAETKPAAEMGGTSSSSISITMDKSDHQANYSCLLYNELNVDNKLIKSIVLSVQYSPSIGFRPYSIYNVKRGDRVQIECDVDANPPVSRVTWTKDSVPLAGSSRSRSIASVGVSDQGTYKCTAKNSIGESSGNLELGVQYAPIIKVPSTKTVNEGEEVSIVCEIDANPKPYEVQWSKVGSPGQTQNDETLSIPTVNRQSAGNYSCKAVSQLRLSGEGVKYVSTEMFTFLYVRYKPGKASISGNDEVDVGERLAITCTATPAGYPEATYTWTKDGVTLTQTGQTYSKSSASLQDNGRYSCTPSNSRGTGEAASVDIRVYEPPKIIQAPTLELHVKLSDTDPLSLRCGAQGYPEPVVTWYQDGYSQDLGTVPELFTVVQNRKSVGDHSVRVESILEFRGSSRDEVSPSQRSHLKIRDMGNYTCKAETNKHTDTPTAVTQLLINFPPVLEQTSTRYAVTRLDTLTLQCQAQAHPPPAFQWFFKGQRLSSDPGEITVAQTAPFTSGVSNIKSSLTIVKIVDENFGLYKCLAINALGNSSVEIEVTTKSRPEQPTDLRVLSKTWESVHLAWTAGFDGGYTQKFFINRTQAVVPLSARSFNITKLHPSTSYTFRVYPGNQLGVGPPSSSVVVKTSDIQIPSLPEIPVFNSKELKLLVTSPEGNLYCLRVKYKANGEWRSLSGCKKVVGDTLEMNQRGIRAINVSVCLSHRPDVCATPMAADIHSTDKEPTLTEDHVIIIACVCAVIIITLLIILVCFCIRRKRYIAKGSSQGPNQGDPPPYQAVPPNKKPVTHNHHNHTQHGGYDNQDSNRMDGYPNRDLSPQGIAISGPHPPHSPSKDKYIDLQDRGGGGDLIDGGGNKGGYPDDQTAAGGKPKKKLKWRWYWRKKEVPAPSPPPFSHNPPGHNCGLPCCNQTLEVEVKPIPNQRGCVVVPIVTPAELSESNFVMKKAHRPSSLPFGNFPVHSQSHDAFHNFYETPSSSVKSPWMGTSRDSTPDDAIEDDVSDGEYDEDTLGRRLIRIEHRTDVIAPEPSAELIAMHGMGAVEESATLLRRRNKPLAQWEQIKHRHFTLPDSPQTPHHIMFLNHQPGESTDYHPDRDSGYMSPGHTSTLKSELMNTLKKYETLANEQEKASDEKKNTKAENNSPNGNCCSNDSNIAEKNDISDSKSVLSEGNVSLFSKEGSSPDRRGSKAKITETSLPPLPIMEVSIRDSLASTCKSDTPLIEEDNESLIEDTDHIYDVVNDVKAASDKLAQDEKAEKEKHEKEEREVECVSVSKIENKNLSKVKSSASDLLNMSDSDMDSGSSGAYNASVSDYNTESYIYNGSLWSQKKDGDNTDSIYYQGSLLRHRFVAERSKKPIIFMMGGRPIVLNKKNTGIHDREADFQQYYNSSQRSDISCSSSEQRIVPKLQLDCNIRRRLSLIDSHGEDFVKSKPPPVLTINDGMAYSGGLPLSGLNIDSSTKLKLWDLRLISINREENNYSTFPPRRPASEDLCIGSFSRTPGLGFRHRHNSDVATDQYVGQKIQRILRSPVLTRSTGVANFATFSDLEFPSDLALKTLNKIDGSWGTGKGINSSRNFLNPMDFINDGLDGKVGDLNLYPSLFDADEESSVYESPSFSRIYRLSLHQKGSGSDSKNDSGGGGCESVFSSSRTGGSVSGGVSGSKGGSGSGIYDADSSLYGGSIYGSTFGWKGIGEYNFNKRNRKDSDSKSDYRHDKEREKDPNHVVWGDASFVDWRRQASLFKDRQFITMIL